MFDCDCIMLRSLTDALTGAIANCALLALLCCMPPVSNKLICHFDYHVCTVFEYEYVSVANCDAH